MGNVPISARSRDLFYAGSRDERRIFITGAAATLADVVSFYDQQFAIGLTAQEKRDLVAFLASL